jgi:hypothetical protein
MKQRIMMLDSKFMGESRLTPDQVFAAGVEAGVIPAGATNKGTCAYATGIGIIVEHESFTNDWALPSPPWTKKGEGPKEAVAAGPSEARSSSPSEATQDGPRETPGSGRVEAPPIRRTSSRSES